MTSITGSMLHDLLRCEHRVTMDVFADPAGRDPPSEFIEMLWAGGAEHELAVVDRLLALHPGAVDLRSAASGRCAATAAAMDVGATLIVGGEIAVGDRLGRPDLMRRKGSGYVPGDIKLGRSAEGAGAAPRLRYAVQTALYADVLDGLGRLGAREAFVIDGRGDEAVLPLDAPLGPRRGTLADAYATALARARGIVAGAPTLSARAADCKLCAWHGACSADVAARDDLTRIPQLGRSLRDRLSATFPTVAALAAADLGPHILGARTAIPGVGADRLRRFQARARLLSTPGARAYATAPLPLPARGREFLLDVETDPLADVCYLHGVVERRTDGAGGPARYHAFVADGPDGEGEAFGRAMDFLESDPRAPVIFWSKYERTTYRSLSARYPDIVDPARVDALFDGPRAFDLLYDVVSPLTEWPCCDHSVKTLAVHLGFAWRDAKPGGAASIAWYREWQETGDPALLTRILEYNEDDNAAVAVVLDALRAMPIGP